MQKIDLYKIVIVMLLSALTAAVVVTGNHVTKALEKETNKGRFLRLEDAVIFDTVTGAAYEVSGDKDHPKSVLIGEPIDRLD